MTPFTIGGILDFSVVIPTWNRAGLVNALLESLQTERLSYSDGQIEVLVIDSSAGAEKQSIEDSCSRFDAIYIEGDDSVRKKRNLGIKTARFPYIIFIDSDVTVEKGLLDAYAQAYEQYHADGVKIGGVLGYTEFVGEKTFWWKAVERTSLVDSFSFARMYPFHSWTIGNNVSFMKSVLEEIGLFEENLPFRLGSDDLDLSYRVTKAGYMIGSAPNAVTYHSRETWNNLKAIHNRTSRWGTMEWYIFQRHPELEKLIIPKDYVIESVVLLWMIALSVICGSFIPLITVIIWLLLNTLINYIVDMRRNGPCSPLRYAASKIIQMQYEFYRIKQSVKNQSAAAFYKGMVFNHYQIRFGLASDSKRVMKLLFTFIGTATVVMWVARIMGLS